MVEIETTHGTSLRARKRQQTRMQIMQAAYVEFQREGFEAARVAVIAHRANVSEKTLFNYFPSKEVLLKDLVIDWAKTHAPEIEESDELKSKSIIEVLPPDMEQRLKLIGEHRLLLAMASAHTDLFIAHRQPGVPLLQRNLAARMTRIAKLQAIGVVRKDLAPDEICDLFHALRDHVIARWLSEPQSALEELQENFEQAMKVFLQGLKAPAP